jgi:hypothetical protein
MLVQFTKNPPSATGDALKCVRVDGSTSSATMRRQGVLPHAMIHFVVESVLEWNDAFFGTIARGASIESLEARLHGQGATWSKMTQTLQSESLVECLQAELWSGPADPAEFAEKLVTACRRRGVPPPDITADEIDRVRVALREFGAAWRPLAPGSSLERRFAVV